MKHLAIIAIMMLGLPAHAERPCASADDPLGCLLEREPRSYIRSAPQDFRAVFQRQASYLSSCSENEREVVRFFEFSPVMLGNAEFREAVSRPTGELALSDAECLARVATLLSPEALRFLRMDLKAPVYHEAPAVEAAVRAAVGNNSKHPLAGL